jgi:amino acid transporter
MRNPEFVASVVLTVIFAFVIAIWVPGEPAMKVRLAISYGGLVLIFLFGFMILAGIASGKIDISQVLAEKDPDNPGAHSASMSRFQLMIFTFVIAISFFLIVANTGDFPEKIPPEVLTLLGISATTYGVSKGIQASAKTKKNGNGAVGADEPAEKDKPER